MLNRAPTLHRLSIQAFQPVLIEGKAIKLHPLVCTAFNADFDGDQMAVHVPLSLEAQIECRLQLMSINNLFSPADGRPVVSPTQDIVLGLYYLTKERAGAKGEGHLFASRDEVTIAYFDGYLDLHARVKLRLDIPVWGQEKPSLVIQAEAKNNKANNEPEVKAKTNNIIETTVGRVFFNEILPLGYGFVNDLLDKKRIGAVIADCYKRFGQHRTVKLLDDAKQLGFIKSTEAGISIAMSDLTIPEDKPKIITAAKAEVAKVDDQYRKGIITGRERYNKVIDVWTHTTETLSDMVFKKMDPFNPVYIMADSGARGSKLQIRQLSGMRGLMAKPSGEIIENPITASFREGLTVLEYFISTHGARKGLADTALKTADAGYLTRRLVDVAQEVVVNIMDCGTVNGITVSAITEGDELVVSLKERIVGRVALDSIVDIVTDTQVVASGDVITEEKADIIEQLGIEKVRIRSVLTCEADQGICVKCYGRNLATHRLVEIGEAVGTIAAQSIGEPGTQLTMRTFHIGGTASRTIEQSFIKVKQDGIVKYHQLRAVQRGKEFIVLNRNGAVSINNEYGREFERHPLPQGASLAFADGQNISKGEIIATWDPYTIPIITEAKGKVSFEDLIEDSTYQREENPVTGVVERVVVEHKQEFHPQIIINDDKGEVVGIYSIPVGAHILVNDKDVVSAGSLIAKIPRGASKTRDITGGLPRVAELFEARRPKDPAVISEIDGVCEFGEDKKGLRTIIVKSSTGMAKEYTIPHGKHPNVYKGDHVFAGQQLTDGPVVPHDILRVSGDKALQEYLLNEVQEVYRLQGVRINDKHIEIIISQMLKKVRIDDAGDADFIVGDQVDRVIFKKANEAVLKKKGKPAQATPLLLGITKVSLTTESFISAASFQETTRVLTEAAASGKIDLLRGLKENVIVGHLIPAGTGINEYNKIESVKYANDIAANQTSQTVENQAQ